MTDEGQRDRERMYHDLSVSVSKGILWRYFNYYESWERKHEMSTAKRRWIDVRTFLKFHKVLATLFDKQSFVKKQVNLRGPQLK